MTLTIDLTPEEESRLQVEAAKQGLALQEVAKQLVLKGLPPPQKTPQEQAAQVRALFAQWAAEDEARFAKMTPEEIAVEEASWDEIMENLQNNRFNLPVPDVSDHD